MSRQASPEIDDELFNEVYGKAYTGPPRYADTTAEAENTNKKSTAEQSDEEDEPRDPNAVPTDFTSREAKVWEAKAKATERNWKKRKEEEMICKICGESGHFTQGCPSTLGSSRKTADFFERVAARDKHVRALLSGKAMAKIERDIGCKLKLEEKFLIVSGKDRLILSKGVDAVHKLIQGDKGKSKSPSSNRTRSKSPDRSPRASHFRRSRSPDRSPRASHFRRSESQRYSSPRDASRSQIRSFNQERVNEDNVREDLQKYSSPRDASRSQIRSFNQERVNEDNVREDLQKLSRDPSHAYANEGATARSARSRSPLRSAFAGDSFSSYDGRNQITGLRKTNIWEMEMHGTDSLPEHQFDFPSCPLTLEESEMVFNREVMELARVRDKEEDEENYKHREYIRELRDSYTKKLAIMRGLQTKQWEEFLKLSVQRRQQIRHDAYNQPFYADYNQSSRNVQFAGSGMPMDVRDRYPYPDENYSTSRPHEAYGELQRQRHDDLGKAYGGY